MTRVLLILAMVLLPATAGAQVVQPWNANPNNWQNSPDNWNNSPNNWKNSPDNWQNSPDRWGNKRLIYDSQGNPQGYGVPRPDGGVNYFDFQGNRRGYRPGR